MIIQLQRSRLRVQSVVNARPFACWERYHIRLISLRAGRQSVYPARGMTSRTRVSATGLRQVTTFSSDEQGSWPCSTALFVCPFSIALLSSQ